MQELKLQTHTHLQTVALEITINCQSTRPGQSVVHIAVLHIDNSTNRFMQHNLTSGRNSTSLAHIFIQQKRRRERIDGIQPMESCWLGDEEQQGGTLDGGLQVVLHLGRISSAWG